MGASDIYPEVQPKILRFSRNPESEAPMAFNNFPPPYGPDGPRRTGGNGRNIQGLLVVLLALVVFALLIRGLSTCMAGR